MTRLTLSLLGSYQVTLEGHPIEAFESDKVRLLLAYLAVENDRPVPRGKLVGLFWPEQDEGHARGNLSQALYNLRSALGERPQTGDLSGVSAPGSPAPFLLVTPQTVQLNPLSDQQVDVSRFKALQADIARHPHHHLETCSECARKLSEAASLYRGDLLAGYTLRGCQEFEEWLLVQREGLHHQAAETLFHLARYSEGQGETTAALAHARRLVALDPLEEKAQRMLMRLLALDGQQAAALAHYQSFRQLLAVELGVEPELETRAFYARLQAEAGTAPQSTTHLPAPLTPLVGRRDELVELTALVRDPNTRLVTVLGPGGCGKTRLVLEVARRLSYHFRDGVCFVPLSALGAGSSMLAAIAEWLGFTFRDFGDHKRQLLDYLRNKKILLILDSFETVVDSAGLVAEILIASEGSKALVTSRVRLNLSGEHIFPLSGLHFPAPIAERPILEYSSVELFLDSARRVRPGLIPEDLNEVARICQLLEGMPLGLLLASSWVSDYPIQEIAEQISRSLDFLSVEWADLPERQRSLRATFEYSWDLLSSREQQVLMKLSVFRNAFSVQAAFEVAGASPQVLHALVGKSLLGNSAEGQYQMHDLVRQYSQEKLILAADGLEKAARQRHSEYFLRMAAGWSSLFKGPGQITMLAKADKQIDDVRAAWDWVYQQAEIDCLNNGLEGLGLYYELSARFKEGQGACQGAAERLAVMDTLQACSLLADLRIWQSRFSRLLGELEPAHRQWEEALELARRLESLGLDVHPLQAFIWLEAGEAILTADLKMAREHLQRSIDLYRQIGDTWHMAAALVDLGINLQHSGNYNEATEPLTECIEIRRAMGDRRGLAYALTWLAFNFSRIGLLEKCGSLMHESMAINKSIGDKASLANGLLWIGRLMVWQGKFEQSFDLLGQSLPLYRDLGDRYNLTFAYMLITLGRMLAGDYEQVKEYGQVQMKLARENGLGRELASSLYLLGCAALAEGKTQEARDLVQESVDLLRQVGHQDELGWALAVLANIQYTLGLPQSANIALAEALHITVKTHAHQAIMFALSAMASILAREDRVVQAVELYTLVLGDPIWKVSPWMEKVVGQHVTAASASLPEEVVEAARQRGRQRDLFATVQELLDECTARVE